MITDNLKHTTILVIAVIVASAAFTAIESAYADSISLVVPQATYNHHETIHFYALVEHAPNHIVQSAFVTMTLNDIAVPNTSIQSIDNTHTAIVVSIGPDSTFRSYNLHDSQYTVLVTYNEQAATAQFGLTNESNTNERNIEKYTLTDSNIFVMSTGAFAKNTDDYGFVRILDLYGNVLSDRLTMLTKLGPDSYKLIGSFLSEFAVIANEERHSDTISDYYILELVYEDTVIKWDVIHECTNCPLDPEKLLAAKQIYTEYLS